MSAAMLSALKKKKQGQAVEGDHQDMVHSDVHSDDKSKDMHSLVKSLDEGQKSTLKTLLQADAADTSKIAKGGPSTEEKGHIQDAITKENGTNQLEESQEDSSGSAVHDSDDIAKSMLDSKHLGDNPPVGKPRNLGERMKMSLAAKLKGKGKI